ncbi:S-adenosylmethionine transporter of the mitochondrial inner membrane, member of the mitochondrial ca [Myxozyma melibiosi]|uniref:S-adenosylmethionine transporter of the mitochondrial inner membrane, member of the mitochondrial ca n=1 Tax=Myxozyma melibiosi TaxID=54550 RepID=A0ABR1EZZ0_9ASCO
MEQHPILIPLLSGGAAGTCTDLFFFPIDTLKTRLQAKGGFFKNGGWTGMYRGVGSAIVGSAPGASLFFLTYEAMKSSLLPLYKAHLPPSFSDNLVEGLTHMTAASLGEIAACTVRVPTEVVKQRAQASQYSSSLAALKSVLANDSGEGVFRGLYRGYSTTIMREIPFTMIQFPLYERMKHVLAARSGRDQANAAEGALCGSVAGGIAAATTTPLDVLKTRMMLSESRISAAKLLAEIWKEEGLAGFYKGVGPRTMWISLGGAVFLGVYEAVKSLVTVAVS